MFQPIHFKCVFISVCDSTNVNRFFIVANSMQIYPFKYICVCSFSFGPWFYSSIPQRHHHTTNDLCLMPYGCFSRFFISLHCSSVDFVRYIRFLFWVDVIFAIVICISYFLFHKYSFCVGEKKKHCEQIYTEHLYLYDGQRKH